MLWLIMRSLAPNLLMQNYVMLNSIALRRLLN